MTETANGSRDVQLPQLPVEVLQRQNADRIERERLGEIALHEFVKRILDADQRHQTSIGLPPLSPEYIVEVYGPEYLEPDPPTA